MAIRKITEDVLFLGSIDWDRRLFDELIPLPAGTSYNCYLVKGSEKTALLDTVDPAKTGELITKLKHLNLTDLDYIIAHHAEQDHSGSIPAVLAMFPKARVVTNQKCATALQDLLHIDSSRFTIINDGDRLSLGNKSIKFIFTPWVHWPETMVSYLEEDKVLFSCDFLASHLATSYLFTESEARVYESAKRYYAEIMMPFRATISKNLDKISTLDIKFIAPSHGPVYSKPEFIINAYKDWTADSVKNQVLVPYVSMHESTKILVDRLIDSLIEKDIVVKPFNLTRTDLGELAISLVDAATMVVGTPTVLGGPHPQALYAAALTNALRPKLKYISVIGSYGWGGKAVETLASMLTGIKPEIIEPVLIKGLPKEDDLKKIDGLAGKIYAKHKELGLI